MLTTEEKRAILDAPDLMINTWSEAMGEIRVWYARSGKR